MKHKKKSVESNPVYLFIVGLVTKSCLTLVTPWTVACQAPLSMAFSRQEYWSGLPFPFPGDLPDPGIEASSPALHSKLEIRTLFVSSGGLSLSFLQHFVSERKYDEDLGRVARFTCDVETLKKNIDSFGQGEMVRDSGCWRR